VFCHCVTGFIVSYFVFYCCFGVIINDDDGARCMDSKQ